MRQPVPGDVYTNECSYITINRVRFVLEEYEGHFFILTETGKIAMRPKLGAHDLFDLVFLE